MALLLLKTLFRQKQAARTREYWEERGGFSPGLAVVAMNVVPPASWEVLKKTVGNSIISYRIVLG